MTDLKNSSPLFS